MKIVDILNPIPSLYYQLWKNTSQPLYGFLKSFYENPIIKWFWLRLQSHKKRMLEGMKNQQDL